MHEHGARDLRPAEPLRTERDERLRGRPARPLGAVGGQVARLRRDAEGDGARGHRTRSSSGGRARAELSREGGFDGTEVHISHSYLLHQFLSPLYNKRTDEYGGSFENRLRFAREVIADVRSRVGTDWVVGVRISLSDFIPGALDVDDAIRVAQTLEADGQPRLRQRHGRRLPQHLSRDPALRRARRLPRRPDRAGEGGGLELPVFTVGGIKDPALAEEILASGKADMVAMTRAQIADPEFANKAQRGPRGRDRPLHPRQPGLHRPRLQGPADQLHGQPRRRAARVGSAAARRRPSAAGALARRRRRPGRDEGRRRRWPGAATRSRCSSATIALGGQVNLILQTPGRDEFGWIVARPRTCSCGRLGVEVRLGTEATAGRCAPSSRRTASLVATGASPSRTGFSSVNPLVEQLPGVDAGQRGDGLGRAARRRARSATGSSSSTTTARARSRASAEVLLDRGKQVELVSRWPTLFPGDADDARHGARLRRVCSARGSRTG